MHTVFWHETTGVNFLKEGGVKGDDYIYDLFPIVFVHCIDLYADHCSLSTNQQVSIQINQQVNM